MRHLKVFLALLLAMASVGVLIADKQSPSYVRSRVVDEDGMSLQWVNVICMQGDKRITGTQTNAFGRFNLRVPEGNFRLRFTLIGHETRDSIFVEVAAGDTISLAPITLIARPEMILDALPINRPKGRILVSIEDVRGTPLDDVVVECLLDSATVREETSGLNGKVRFSNMESGTYKIRCSRPGYKSAVFPKAVVKRGEDTSLVITLKRKG